jgi:hypothetical protein
MKEYVSMGRKVLISVFVVGSLFTALPADGQVSWFRVEDGTTNPVIDPYWNSLDDMPSMVTLGSGPTLTGDYAFVNINDDDEDHKIKIRHTGAPLPFDGSGNTMCAILRVNSGGGTNNYGFENKDSFGEFEVALRKNEFDDDGYIRNDSGGAEIPVTNITDWHVYWITHDPSNQVRIWVDPDEFDTSQGTADSVSSGDAGSPGNQVTWGTESSGQLMNYDVDLIQWARGVHAPADGLPPLATPTPTVTGTPPTLTPTVTSTETPGLTPTPTFTAIPHTGPVIVLTTVRQLGSHENGDFGGTGGMRALYIHLSDVDGNRLNGADCWARVNGGPGQSFLGQTGVSDVTFPDFCQYEMFAPTDYVEVRVVYNGVSSDYTPILYRNVPDKNHLYSWELFFVYIPNMGATENTYVIRPLRKSYDYAHVKLNTATGYVNDPPDYDYESDYRDTIQDPPSAALNTYSQTFVATGNRVVAAKAFVTCEFYDPWWGLAVAQYQATIHEGGPSGPQVGGSSTPPKYFSFEYPKVTAFWPLDGPGAVEVTPGETYALKVTKVPSGFTGLTYSLYTSQTDTYPDGDLYRDGVVASPAQDMVGIVVTLNSLPKSGTPTPTLTPYEPQTGVEYNWKFY